LLSRLLGGDDSRNVVECYRILVGQHYLLFVNLPPFLNDVKALVEATFPWSSAR
jgi:hypothetical protein